MHMARENILIVEDDKDILELLEYNLGREGYKTLGAETGEDGLKIAEKAAPDLVLLDLMLPGIDGLEVCRKLKAGSSTSDVPIIMITAKGEETDVVTGLELGADDYVTKPFSVQIVIARIRAVLRRRSTPPPDETKVLKVQGITIHPGRHEVQVGEKQIELTPTEFNILHLLAGRPGWVFTRYQIVDGVRGDDAIVTDRSVDVQIVGLRKKLGSKGYLIETVRGVGYRFKG
jgi:two-component system phosphate regulon response regulator PhoB